MCANTRSISTAWRLITWRGAPVPSRIAVRKEAALAAAFWLRQGHADRPDGVQLLGGHYQGSIRLSAGTAIPRAIGVVPRRCCHLERAESPIMAINLELPRKRSMIIVKTHQGAGDDAADSPQVRPEGIPGRTDTLDQSCSRAPPNVQLWSPFPLRDEDEGKDEKPRGAAVVQTMEASWGDVAMMPSLPLLQRSHLRGSHRRDSWSGWAKVWQRWPPPNHRSDSAGSVDDRHPRRRRVRDHRRESCRRLSHPHRGLGHAGQTWAARRLGRSSCPVSILA